MRARAFASIAALALIVGCAPTTNPPSAPDTATPVLENTPTPASSTAGLTGRDLRIGVLGPGPPGLNSTFLNSTVFSSLYRLDASLNPVPSLATEPCAVSAAGTTYTCHLRDERFHDGSPLTADDVVFSFELAMRAPCPLGGGCPEALRAITAVDPKTVRFELDRPYGPFASKVLTGPILPRRAVEASFDRYMAHIANLDPAAAEALATSVEDELGKARPDCASLVPQVEAIFKTSGVVLPYHIQFTAVDGRFDDCSYLSTLGPNLRDLASSRKATGLDAESIALNLMDYADRPIGSGPWRWASFDGRELVLESDPNHMGGPPASPRIRFTVFAESVAPRGPSGACISLGVGSRLGGGAPPPDLMPKLQRAPGIKVLSTPAYRYFAVMYNMRPGRLFADPAIREAVERCIDKVALVDAATGGSAIPINSYVTPASWAYLGPSSAQDRDVTGARTLLEQDGWTLASDGIYQKAGRRLTFDVLVRADADDRVKFVDLLAFQERDCGIDVKTHPADFDALVSMQQTYPHTVPGGKEPFDAYFGGWTTDPDPGSAPWFDSRQMTVADPPTDPTYGGWDFTGYANLTVDELFDQGLATSDQKQRARIYRELQTILAEDRPYLFVWSPLGVDAVSTDVRSLDGELPFASQNWFWAPERIVVGGR